MASPVEREVNFLVKTTEEHIKNNEINSASDSAKKLADFIENTDFTKEAAWISVEAGLKIKELNKKLDVLDKSVEGSPLKNTIDKLGDLSKKIIKITPEQIERVQQVARELEESEENLDELFKREEPEEKFISTNDPEYGDKY